MMTSYKCKQTGISILHYVKINEKTTSQAQTLFSVLTTRLHESLEGLNSSLAYCGGELRPYVMWV